MKKRKREVSNSSVEQPGPISEEDQLDKTKQGARSSIRVGIVGYGSLGQFLVKSILDDSTNQFSISFVWNRTKEKLNADPMIKKSWIIDDLESVVDIDHVDLIVEVAHPQICIQYAKLFCSGAGE